jgi:4-amino-4-deoxy-L-arabinose transferase-like glycosyltransferase
VWSLHPFWEISDGKVINHWLIAAFYPQHAPDFVGRLATVLVGMIGLAAGYALVRRWYGAEAALMGGVLWLCAPYLFFYERTALSDAQAGALVVLTLWGALHTARRGHWRPSVLTGAALALAALFKFTAAPFALMVLIVIMAVGRQPFRRRIRNLAIIGLIGVVAFATPVLYVAVRGTGFDVALGWIAGSGSRIDGDGRIAENITRLLAQMTDYGITGWSVLLGIGLAMLAVFGIVAKSRRLGLALLAAWGVPFSLIVLLGMDVQPRHFVVALPTALLLGGAGIGALLLAISRRSLRAVLIIGLIAVLSVQAGSYFLTTYWQPAALALPAPDRYQFISSHSAGFGLREAARHLPMVIDRPDSMVLASMFPDSCRRTNFYLPDDLNLICTDAPGLDRLATLLSQRDVVYVLVERPPIGIDMLAVPGVSATRLTGYPRPGETEQDAAVTLWKVTRPDQ